MGVAPNLFSFSPEQLKALGVQGVINLCDEYRGPVAAYNRIGIEELYLPTIDHTEPSLNSLKEAVKFISKFEKKGQKVYVHCKAGHGRSAAVVFCWLFAQDPTSEPQHFSNKLSSMRRVRKNLHLQSSSIEFMKYFRDNLTIAKQPLLDESALTS
jgi:atypical dual specificity phosphatase